MSEALSWIHLSDVHVGGPAHRDLFAGQATKLMAALREQVGRLGAPHFILFSGDLVWNADRGHFNKVDDLFERLREAVGDDVLIIPVPGNHDVTWRDKTDAWIGSLLELHDDTRGGTQLRALRDRSARVVEELARPFAEYRAWIERSVRPAWDAAEARVRQGLLPGDFLLSFERAGMRVGVVGCNTAWVSTFDEALTKRSDGFRGLVGAVPQQLLAIDGFVPRCEANHVNLLVAHHPLSWWSSGWKKEFLQDVYDPELFLGMFSGHEHLAASEENTGDSGLKRLFFHAGSLHGVDGYSSSREDRASLVYSWHRILRGAETSATHKEERSRGAVLSDGVFKFEAPIEKPERPIEIRKPRESPGHTVALLAMVAEFGEFFEKSADRLELRAGCRVLRCDAANSSQRERAFDADFVVLLLGSTLDRDGFLVEFPKRRLDLQAFRTKLVDPDALDEDQVQAHAALRKNLRASPSFDDASMLPQLIADAYAEWKQRRDPAPASEYASPLDFERLYLETQVKKWAHGDLSVFLGGGERPIDRAEIYVPIRCRATDRFFESKSGELTVLDEGSAREVIIARSKRRLQNSDSEVQPGGDDREDPRAARLLCHEALRRAIVRGHPGSGKTVLLQHLAHVLASQHLGEPVTEHEMDLSALGRALPLSPVPIFLSAKDVAERLRARKELKSPSLTALLEAMVDAMVRASGGQRPAEEIVLRGFTRGRYVVLVDALDEIPDQETRQPVLDLLESIPKDAASRVILTTRPTADTGRLRFPDSCVLLEIADLSSSSVRSLAERYGAARAREPSWATECVGAIEESEQRLGAAILSRNPLQLTAALSIYARSGSLPDSPEQLYREIVDDLCGRRLEGLKGWTKDDVRHFLREVFLIAQEHGFKETPLEQVQHIPYKFGAQDASRATTMFNDVGNATGLIRFEERPPAEGMPGGTVLIPWHRTFQEFLAAERLGQDSVEEILRRLTSAENPKRRPPFPDPDWTMTLRFLVGCLSHRLRDLAAELVNKLQAKLPPPSSADDVSKDEAAGLATLGAAVADYAQGFAGVGDFLPRFTSLLYDAFRARGERWPLGDRENVLEALGRLGDPRLDPKIESPWVLIPAGTYPLGGDDQAFQSLRPTKVPLGAFRICWRVVTVDDFAPFVARGGYTDLEAPHWKDPNPKVDVPAWLRESKITAPEGWPRQRHHRTHPVTGVSAWEADAFCRWASVHDRDRWALGPPEFLDLPTAEESEAAARGPRGLVFPWGKDEPTEEAQRAAFGGNGRRRLAPVGCFPAGLPKDKRKRMADLAGNVWEWTRSAWRDDANLDPWRTQSLPGLGSRVVRGGSWLHDPRDLRCAARDGGVPEHRFVDLGFRVVVRGSLEHVH